VTPDASLLGAAGWGLAASAALALGTWALSVPARDVGIVDSVWAFLVLLPACAIAWLWPHAGPRANVALALAAVWALRLSVYITWRHRGQPEDRRYQAIRARNEPNFEWKSLYLVFGLQVVLAFVVATPLMAAVAGDEPWHALDVFGITLVLTGLALETVADAQLARFKSDPAQRGRVLSTGLWRYSRHPNYFGECCVWWGIWLLALASGAWWTIVSPLLMTVLLLKISGVALLERDIAEHRPGYRDYVRRTSAFVPWCPRP
jgi:steroid 5-alpha reductase family enzyme